MRKCSCYTITWYWSGPSENGFILLWTLNQLLGHSQNTTIIFITGYLKACDLSALFSIFHLNQNSGNHSSITNSKSYCVHMETYCMCLLTDLTQELRQTQHLPSKHSQADQDGVKLANGTSDMFWGNFSEVHGEGTKWYTWKNKGCIIDSS